MTRWICWLGAVCMALNLFAQTNKTPLQTEAIEGELPNGLRYVIRENNKPAHRISFRLVMSVGSQQEKEGYEGVAHFIEHLAFRSSKHFPHEGIVKHLQEMGEKYGVTINAFTGYDRTVFMFSMPSDNKDGVEWGLKVLKEWLTNINFLPDEVQKEKPIIKEEIKGYDASLERVDSLKKGLDKPLHRLPIGTPTQIDRVTPNVLKKFYHTFYQPQNASLVIVGSGFDATNVQQEIIQLFSNIKGNVHHRIVSKPILYPNDNAYINQYNDDCKRVVLERIFPLKTKRELTADELLEHEKQELLMRLVNLRWRLKGVPMSVSQNWYLNRTDLLSIKCEAKTADALLESVLHGYAILKGMEMKGFTPWELDYVWEEYEREKNSLTYDLESDRWCDHYIDILLTDTRNVASKKEMNYILEQLGKLTLNDWNHQLSLFVKQLDTPSFCCFQHCKEIKDLPYSAWQKAYKDGWEHPDEILPAEEQLHGKKNVLTAHLDLLDKSMIPFDYTPNYSSVSYPILDMEELKLPNGATIWLKHTDNPDSLVNVNMIYPGGLSLIPKKDYGKYESVASYMSLGGIEGVDEDVLAQVMADNGLSIINTMENYWHGIMATAPASKLNQLANLILMKCYRPKKCYSDFEEIKKDLMASLKDKKDTPNAMQTMIQSNPERALRQRMDSINGNILPTAREVNSQDAVALNLDSIARFYRQLYTNSKGLTCIITGNFDTKEVKSLFTAMLRHFKPTDVSRETETSGKQTLHTVDKVGDSSDDKRITFDDLYLGDYKLSLKGSLILKLMRDVLRNRVIDIIRNKEGLIYSPYVDLYYHAIPTPTYCIDVNGEIDAQNMSRVRKEITEIIANLAHHKVSLKELNSIKKSFLLTKEGTLLPDAMTAWKEYLSNSLKECNTLSEMAHYQEILQSITADEVMNGFQQMIKGKNTLLYIGNYDEKKN